MKFWLFLLLCLWPSLSEAAIINAATCQIAEVQSKVNTAASGDTVVIPAGTCTWNATLTMPTRPMTLQGAGGTNTKLINGVSNWNMITWVTSANTVPGVHRITGIYFDGSAVTTSSEPQMLYITGSTPSFRFDHNRVDNKDVEIFRTYGFVRGVFDHNIMNLSGIAYVTHMFHTDWNNVGMGGGCGTVGCGDGSYAADDTMGLAGNGGAVYFEDNIISCTVPSGTAQCWYAFDGWGGARIVTRYNTINDTIHGSMHGTESGGRGRGYRHSEYYREKWISTDCVFWGGAVCDAGAGWRGGTGRIFDIVASSTGTGGFHVNQFLTITNIRAICQIDGNGCDRQWGSCGTVTLPPGALTSTGTRARVTFANHHLGVTATVGGTTYGSAITISGASGNYNGTFFVVNADGSHTAWFEYDCLTTCGATATGTITYRSPFDQNSDQYGYRCLDNAGAGKDTGAWIGLAEPFYIPLANATWPTQELKPVYSWNNTIIGGTSPGLQPVNNTSGADFSHAAQEDRDFYDDVGASCAPSAGTCASGVGRGLRTQRPLACVTGTAWWHTDTTINWNTSTTDAAYNPSGLAGEDGGLDICVNSGTPWSNDAYVPFTYPHPLQAGAGAPSAPTGLQVQ